jgi:hypothetical protein
MMGQPIYTTKDMDTLKQRVEFLEEVNSQLEEVLLKLTAENATLRDGVEFTQSLAEASNNYG